MKVILFWSIVLLWNILSGNCSQDPNEEFSHEQYVPNLTSMQNLPIVAGSSIVLNCNVSNYNSSPEITWFDPDHNPITSDNRLFISREDMENDNFLLSQLTFFRIRTSEAGTYSCVANISLFGNLSVIVGNEINVTVKIQTPSSIVVEPNRQGPLYEGTTYGITCSIRMNTDVVDTDIQPKIQVFPPHATINRFSYGDVVQVNETTYAIMALFEVLSIGDRRSPNFIITISPAPSDIFVYDSTVASGGVIVIDVSPLPPLRLIISTSSTVTGGESLSLTCTGYVVDHLAVNATIEWFYVNGSRSQEIPGALQITEVQDVTNYTSTLTFSSLRTSHGGLYRCSIDIDIPVISLSLTDEGNTNVTVTLPRPSTSVNVTSNSLYIGGNTTDVICTASLDNITTAVVAAEDRNDIFFTFMWQDSNGNELINNPRVTIDTSATPYSSILSLSSPSLLDIDIVCSVVTNIRSNYFLEPSLPVIKSTNWTLKVLPPCLNITASPIDEHFFGGLRINLTCYIHLHSPIEYPLALSRIWVKPGKISTHVDEDIVQLEPLLYQTSLVIDELDRDGGDDGEYTCRINILSSNARIEGAATELTRIISIEAELFQFEVMNRFFNFDCADWIQDDTAIKAQEIIEKIITETARRCTCDVTAADITDETFSCPLPGSDSTIFRARLHGNTRYSANAMIRFLNEWVSANDSTVRIQLLEYNVNSFCVNGGSANCNSEVVSSLNPYTQNPSLIITIIGGAVSVSIILIIAVCSGVVICVIIKARLKQRHITEMRRQENIQMATMNQHSDNNYEEIGRNQGCPIYDEVGDKAYATLSSLKDHQSEDNYNYTPYTSMAPAKSILNVNDTSTDGDEDYESMKDLRT